MSIKLSVIVPSLNQSDYLRACLESVIGQNYRDLELIVVDGGSTDGSIDVIREFEGRIAWWVSEPDEGQTDAINKGLERATGGVWSFLNSDDLLEPESLNRVSRFFEERPDAEWLSGTCRVFGDGTEDWYLKPAGVSSLREVLTPWGRNEKYVFPQSGACFMRPTVIDKIGMFDSSYHYSMDMEYYTRAVFQGRILQYITEDVLAAWRWHEEAKSFLRGIAYAFREEELRVARKYLSQLEPKDRSVLEQELSSEQSRMLIRKSMWCIDNGQPHQAMRHLGEALASRPLSLVSRPWLGALRRAICGHRNRSQSTSVR